MTWFPPLGDKRVIPTGDHPGAFAVQRKFHRHEGVDLYCDEGTPVFAVEPGVVVAVLPFTGKWAGSPWWENTMCVMVQGESGVVLYGEITARVQEGQELRKGEMLGVVTRVLKKDKGRPMTMLHLELYAHDTRNFGAWENERPAGLMDPTPHLVHAIP